MENKTWKYDLAFDIGDRVRFNNKIGKDEGLVTGIIIRNNGCGYDVTWSDKCEKFHYEFELELMN